MADGNKIEMNENPISGEILLTSQLEIGSGGEVVIKSSDGTGVLDGQDNIRVLRLNSNAWARLEGLQVRNGLGEAGGGGCVKDGRGGCICVEGDATLELDSTEVFGCNADVSGARHSPCMHNPRGLRSVFLHIYPLRTPPPSEWRGDVHLRWRRGHNHRRIEAV